MTQATTTRPSSPAPRMRTATLTVAEAMDSAFDGADCRLLLRDGREALVAAQQWAGTASAADEELFVDPCTGSTLDVGCGPGRLTGALAGRGVAALGTDISGVAVQQTRARGARAIQSDVFDALPGARQWRHLVLADGNIGIGGQPVRLLRRVAQLLHPTGSAYVELHGSGGLRVHEQVRLHVHGRQTSPFAWATVGSDAIHGLAATAGLGVSTVRTVDGRRVATLHLV